MNNLQMKFQVSKLNIILLIGIGIGIQEGANNDTPEEEDSHYEQLADEILGQ